MSIPRKLDLIPQEWCSKMAKELCVKKKESVYSFGHAKWINAFDISDNNIVYIPFSYATQFLPIPKKKFYEKSNLKFIGELREYQEEVRDKEFLPLLNKKHSLILSSFCGWGKTTFAIYIASLISLKTLIVSHRSILISQWEESINRLINNPKLQIITTQNPIDLKNDIFIISAHIIEKLGHIFSKIGLVIVDEVHCIATDTLYKSLFYLSPCYLLGLSATPTRPDGMDILLDLYFGKDRIYKIIKRNHFYFKITTQIEPKIEKNNRGNVDWNVVLSSLAENEKRNEMIVSIVKNVNEMYPKRNFLILTKRVEHSKRLLKMFEKIGISTTYLFGNTNKYDKEAKVLIATVSKVGLGFDHPNLSVLILGADVEEYFIQYLGRVLFRSKYTPWVFDLVDNNSSLLSHFYVRRKVCLGCGGAIIKTPSPINEKEFKECIKNIKTL